MSEGDHSQHEVREAKTIVQGPVSTWLNGKSPGESVESRSGLGFPSWVGTRPKRELVWTWGDQLGSCCDIG